MSFHDSCERRGPAQTDISPASRQTYLGHAKISDVPVNGGGAEGWFPLVCVYTPHIGVLTRVS